MRDEFEGRYWAEHSSEINDAIDRLFRRLRVAFARRRSEPPRLRGDGFIA